MRWSRVFATMMVVAAVLFGAPAVADAQATGAPGCNGDQQVRLMDTRIYANSNGVDTAGNKWSSVYIWDLMPPIPAGTYDIELAGWDTYANRSADPAQNNEVWYVEFLGEGDVVLGTSAKTTDINDGVDLGVAINQVGQINVGQDITAVRTIHGAEGAESANSLMMSCIGLTTVDGSSVDPVTETPDTTEAPATPACGEGMHDNNGVCVAIDTTTETPDTTPVDTTVPVVDTPGECTGDYHDLNGECVLQPDKGGPWPWNPCEQGWHDSNGVCVNDATGCPADMHDENGVCVPDCEASANGGLCTAVEDDPAEETPGGDVDNTDDEVPTSVLGANELADDHTVDGDVLATTGGFAGTWMGWAFGIMLAGAAMALSARAVRTEP
jgi:hypothetical protein